MIIDFHTHVFSDEMPTLFQNLAAAKVDWRVYYSDLPGPFIFTGTLTTEQLREVVLKYVEPAGTTPGK